MVSVLFIKETFIVGPHLNPWCPTLYWTFFPQRFGHKAKHPKFSLYQHSLSAPKTLLISPTLIYITNPLLCLLDILSNNLTLISYLQSPNYLTVTCCTPSAVYLLWCFTHTETHIHPHYFFINNSERYLTVIMS